MITLGSFAIVKSTRQIVEAISSPYTTRDGNVIDVKLAFDPMVIFTANISELELLNGYST